MNITAQMLNGDIPVTEDELRFLAENHETYDLTKLDVSQVRNFSNLFKKQVGFNQPIGNWDVSNCTNFSYMFLKVASFNQPIRNWDVSNGTNFSAMFGLATSFNQPIGNWNVTNGTDFSYMFFTATSFNQPIGNWELLNGTNFHSIFLNAKSFNQNIHALKIRQEYFVQILESNFKLSVKHYFEKIGFTDNADQLSLIFKDSPDRPFFKDFNYNLKELHLIESNGFYGFMDENNNIYQINTYKITIDELIDICDIKIY